MDYENSLEASFWVMVIMQTIGSVDMPGAGSRKMPAPRAYLATLVTWAVLQILADSGRDRAAAIVGWVTVLTGMVVGPFGGKIINLFNGVVNIATQQQ